MRVLKTKPLIIFVLIIPLPFLIIMLGAFLSGISANPNLAIYTSIIAFLIMTISYYGWIWNFGRTMIREQSGFMSQRTFIMLFIISLLLVFIITPILSYFFSLTFGIVILLRLIGFTFFLTCIYISASSFKSQELDEKWPITKTFLSIWFLPFGLWFMKPRIDKVLENVSPDLIAE